jgi:hypothetical protein
MGSELFDNFIFRDVFFMINTCCFLLKGALSLSKGDL